MNIINIERENRNMHFMLDCDDVLLDWLTGFRKWLYASYEIHPDVRGPSTWSLASWLGQTDERSFELIEQFNNSQAFGELLPCPDAVEGVATLRAAGHRLTVLTSCSADHHVTKLRKENLRREFDGAFDRVICLPLGESKATWLDVLRPGIWVEDNYKNALIGANAGNKTFMMRRRHNRADEATSDQRIAWLDDWRPLVSLFS